MITYQVERLADIKIEVAPLLLRHWEEIALNRDTVPLDPNWDQYLFMDREGYLQITTAREDGKIVGYAAYFIAANLHYRSLVVADSDIFWLAPEKRKGMVGVKLLKAAEEHLKAVGVNKIVNKVKLKHDVGAVFERLGYTPIERLYAKLV